MSRYFFDTSALVKRYRFEPGTEVVDRLFRDADSSFAISRLGVIETISALALKVRLNELPLGDYVIARKRFLGDVSEHTLLVARLLVGHYRNAERLIDQHGTERRLRTLDALQLSIALDLHQHGRIEIFVCADAILCEIAAIHGVATLNPLTTP
jgi:hypothetical protein